MALTGCNFVRFSRHALFEIRRTWQKMGDRFEIRRHCLKARFWDERHTHGHGMIFDHEYEPIKALAGLGIYEIRVDDVIGGHDNIRIILFDPPGSWIPTEEHRKPMKTVWVLTALQKKRDVWTKAQIHNFKASRNLLRERAYEA